jgi:hypothetical protein
MILKRAKNTFHLPVLLASAVSGSGYGSVSQILLTLKPVGCGTLIGKSRCSRKNQYKVTPDKRKRFNTEL